MFKTPQFSNQIGKLIGHILDIGEADDDEESDEQEARPSEVYNNSEESYEVPITQNQDDYLEQENYLLKNEFVSENNDLSDYLV